MASSDKEAWNGKGFDAVAVKIKICGVTSRDALDAAIMAEASYVGFVFYEPSPRNISAQLAKPLSAALPANGPKSVGLFVDPSDDDLSRVVAQVSLDLIQLHGKEAPSRISEIRRKFQKPVITAIGISSGDDLGQLSDFTEVSDYLLLDSRARWSSELPGGRGETFDWKILENIKFSVPWMLSGGLTHENVAEAINITGAEMVDVSSGVEIMLGVKDPALIQAFAIEVAGAVAGARGQGK